MDPHLHAAHLGRALHQGMPSVADQIDQNLQNLVAVELDGRGGLNLANHPDALVTEDILRETEEVGLVHTAGNYRDGHFYICNCCTCCCGILRGVAEFGIPTAVAHSDFHAVVDADLCIGCEDCVERCQFGALAVPEDLANVEVDYARCVGCGVCATVCTTDALHLERRPEGETPPLAAEKDEWMVWRAEERGISLSDIL